MTWRRTDRERQGLLPDFFDLRGQVGAGPAINPGTVQAHLAELYGEGTIYDVKKLPNRNWFIHAPCTISNIRQDGDSVTLTTDGWGDRGYYILISGIEHEPRKVLVRGVVQESAEPSAFESAEKEFHAECGSLVIRLRGKSEIRIRY